jgi:hypothetical protein
VGALLAPTGYVPDVSVKLGGMLNRGAALNFRELPAPPNSAAWAAAWRPYVETCIELFGAERCNFEGNFPVDKMGTGYATLWNAFKRITAGCSPTEKLVLYSGTANRLYSPRLSGEKLWSAFDALEARRQVLVDVHQSEQQEFDFPQRRLRLRDAWF